MKTNENVVSSTSAEDKKITNKPWYVKQWFLSQFFKTLLITCLINILIWGGFIAALPFFGPNIESFLFSSVKLIQKLQTDLDRLDHMQIEKGKELSRTDEKLQNEIQSLKDSMVTLTTDIKNLHDQVSLSTANLIVPSSNDISEQWKALVYNFESGILFDKNIQALLPLVSTNKDIHQALEGLVDLSSKQTYPFNKLFIELKDIKKRIEKSDYTDDSNKEWENKDRSWFRNLWEKIKSQLSFERVDSQKTIVIDPSTNKNLIKTLEEAIDLMRNNKFDDAIKKVKLIEKKVKPILDQWIINAEARLMVEKKFDLVKKQIGSFLTAKVQ